MLAHCGPTEPHVYLSAAFVAAGDKAKMFSVEVGYNNF